MLEIQSLIDTGCEVVANMIKGKSPEEIRRTFNIRNDFTPEEEEHTASPYPAPPHAYGGPKPYPLQRSDTFSNSFCLITWGKILNFVLQHTRLKQDGDKFYSLLLVVLCNCSIQAVLSNIGHSYHFSRRTLAVAAGPVSCLLSRPLHRANFPYLEAMVFGCQRWWMQ